MTRFVVERIIATFAVFLAVSITVYSLGSLIPGDLATVLVGSEGATQEQFESLREELGLNASLPVQYVRWLSGALRGDFGVSPITHRSVAEEISQQLPVSMELAIFAMILSTILGIPLGIYAAVNANRTVDIGIRTTFLVIFSIPPFVSGIVLLMIGALYLGPLYKSSYVPLSVDIVSNLRSMFLPTIAIAVPLAAMTLQMTRTTMLESLNEAYIIAARSKGAKERNILFVHALKNALPPIITLQGFQLGSLLGGMIVIELIFNLPGLGRGLLTAISQRDYPLVIATTCVIALVYVIVNMAIDIAYPILDPRQRIS